MNKKQILTKIAKKHCFVETLESRGRDSLDFHDIGVAGLKAALNEAFEAGKKWSNSKSGQAETTEKLNKFLKEGWARVESEKKSSYDPSDEIYWK